jgi:hypothetical protein
MKISVKKDYARSDERLEKTQRMPLEWEFQVISEEAQEGNTSSPLKFKIEPMKPSMKKVRVPYTYWLTPSLLSLICVGYVGHEITWNISRPWNYLRSTNRKSWKLSGV